MKFIFIFLKTFLYTQDGFILQSSDEEVSIIPICKSRTSYLAGSLCILKGRKRRHRLNINEA